MSLTDVIQTALDKMKYLSKTETVFGEPIIAGDVTLIPVSKVSIGFAAGGVEPKGPASGAGAGGGITVVPVAFISITGTKVQIHSIEKNDLGLEKIIAMAPEILGKISSFIDRKKNRED